MKTIDVWRIVRLIEAAHRSGVEHATLRQYVVRHDDFPKPFLTLGKTHLYDWLAIADWLKRRAPYGRVILQEDQLEQRRQAARERFYLSRGLPLPPRGEGVPRDDHESDEGEDQPERDTEGDQEQPPSENDHESDVAI